MRNEEFRVQAVGEIRHWAEWCGRARGLSADRIDDLENDVVIVILTKIKDRTFTWDKEGNWKRYVSSVTRHTALASVRQLRRQNDREASLDEGRQAPGSPADDRILALRDAMNRLSRSDRELIEAIHFEGRKLREITAKYGKSISWASAKARRALSKLRKWIG